MLPYISTPSIINGHNTKFNAYYKVHISLKFHSTNVVCFGVYLDVRALHKDPRQVFANGFGERASGLYA